MRKLNRYLLCAALFTAPAARAGAHFTMHQPTVSRQGDGAVEKGEEALLQTELEEFRRLWKIGQGTGPFLHAKAPKRMDAWRSAAERGSPTAMLFLGRCLADGIGIKKDAERGREYFRKAGDAGQAEALFCLALELVDEAATEREAVALFEKSAKLGCAKSLCMLGVYYASSKRHGLSKEDGLKRAAGLYRQAADVQDPNGMTAWGIALISGEGVEPVAKEGAGAFVGSLGMVLLQEVRGKKNGTEGAEWLRKAAEAGHDEGMYRWASALTQGIGTGKDPREAFRWFKKAAEAGHMDAAFELSCCHSLGHGTAKDEVEGLRWLRLAAESGNAEACLKLCSILLKDKDSPKAQAEAILHLKRPADRGDTRCMVMLCILFGIPNGPAHDLDLSTDWARKAALGGNPLGMIYYGQALKDGAGVKLDPKEAISWFRKSADMGYADGMHKVGLCYNFGIGVEKDDKEAVKWHKRGADGGSPAAIMSYGMSFATGAGVPEDHDEAFKWVKKSAELNDEVAIANLGTFYRDGVGTEKNLAKAVECYRIAADRDVTMALRMLSMCHAEAIGVPRDIEKAKALLRRAAKLGDPEAKEALRSLGWE